MFTGTDLQSVENGLDIHKLSTIKYTHSTLINKSLSSSSSGWHTSPGPKIIYQMASCLPSGNYSWLDSAQSENEPENLTSSSILLQSAKQKIKYRCESWELPNLNALSLGLHLGSQWVAQASSSHRIQPRCDEPPSRPVWFCQLGQLHADDDHYFRCHGWLPSSNQTWRQLPLLGILASSIKSIWLIMAGWFFHCQVWFLEVAALTASIRTTSASNLAICGLWMSMILSHIHSQQFGPWALQKARPNRPWATGCVMTPETQEIRDEWSSKLQLELRFKEPGPIPSLTVQWPAWNPGALYWALHGSS